MISEKCDDRICQGGIECEREELPVGISQPGFHVVAEPSATWADRVPNWVGGVGRKSVVNWEIGSVNVSTRETDVGGLANGSGLFITLQQVHEV